MHKMKPVVLYIIIFLLIGGCSTDVPVTPPSIEERAGDCFDGLLNGPEVVIDCGGDCPGFCPPNSIGILGGEVRGIPLDQAQVAPLMLDPAVEYRLIGPLLVRDGASLSIPAGTIIKVDPDVGAYIAVAQGGSLLIAGQQDNPVVITSGADNPAPGDWGGIIVSGEGPILEGDQGRTDIIDIFYGGINAKDSSGSINYVRIEYAGAVGETGQHFDALAFYGVGAFTNITNVQTYNSMGNGIRFIGGNANANQLIATNSAKNAIVIQDDWSGNGSKWHLNGIGEAGITFRSDTERISLTKDTITNISILGPATNGGLNYSRGGGNYFLENVFTSGLDLGINSTDETADVQLSLGNLIIDAIEFSNAGSSFIPTNYRGINSNFYTERTTTGSGNRAERPDWANGWTLGVD